MDAFNNATTNEELDELFGQKTNRLNALKKSVKIVSELQRKNNK